MDKYIGSMLGGRYQIEEIVGVGGMAVVYRARDTILGRDVALKVLKKEFAEDPDIRKRFSIESRAVAKLSHHNIVSVFDVGSEDGTDYIVMELIEGITLKQYLQRKGHLSWEETIFFAEQVARALMHAHSRGIIHQDVKPQNVIILRDGTAKLTDFGIASFAAAQETRVVQEAIGSVHYISPEQAKGSKIDYRTDLYSLGVMMYEMLTGKLPFEGETALQIVMQHINEVPIIPSAFVPGIPKGMDDIVMHAMSAHISRRYESAEKMYEDMEVLRSDPNARFRYVASEDNSGETQIIGADIQRAARRSAAEHEAASVEGAAAPRTRTRTRTQTRTRTGFRRKEQDEPDGFFEKLAERPGMAVGMAVGVIAVISLLLVGILMITGSSDKSEKIIVPDLIGRNIDEVMADPDITDNFTVKEATERQESDRPVGEILEQDPNADGKKKATKGTIITVTVSSGGENVKDTYKVIDFTGKTLDYVQAALASHDIKCEVVEEYSDDVAEGKIISSSVNKTKAVVNSRISKRANQELTVVVSKGVRMTTIPKDILDANSANGKDPLNALKKAGFDNVKHDESKDEYSMDTPQGVALTISPDPGTTAKHNDEVTVTLSKGPMPVTMPNIVGKTQDEMQAALGELKLTANVTEQYDDKVEAGQVISASQEAGAQLKWGDSVDVVISKGPEMATIPSGLVGKQESAVTKTLEGLGFEVKTDKVLGGLFGTVRTVKSGDTDLSNGGKIRLRDANGNPTVITLTIV